MKRTNDDTVKRIALELSLKPFDRDDGQSYEACAHRVITAWRPLLEAATEVSFMLWVADGSDILEWRGDLDQPLEWARYIGFCNDGYGVYVGRHHAPTRNAILYRDCPKAMRYADLKAIIDALRAALATNRWRLSSRVRRVMGPYSAGISTLPPAENSWRVSFSS